MGAEGSRGHSLSVYERHDSGTGARREQQGNAAGQRAVPLTHRFLLSGILRVGGWAPYLGRRAGDVISRRWVSLKRPSELQARLPRVPSCPTALAPEGSRDDSGPGCVHGGHAPQVRGHLGGGPPAPSPRWLGRPVPSLSALSRVHCRDSTGSFKGSRSAYHVPRMPS